MIVDYNTVKIKVFVVLKSSFCTIEEECDITALKFVDSLGENYIVYRCTRVMILTGHRHSKKLDILFCGLPVELHMQCNRTYRISAFYCQLLAFGKVLTAPIGHP